MQKNTEQMKLENDQIEVIVNYHGAELRSLKKKATDQEYLWNADAKYWGRTSPVLFPFVGGVKNKVYRYEGKEYPMNQHGFARDMEFSLVSQSADEVWFALEDTEETYKVYPFHFHLEIGYRLEDASVSVMWKVKNIMIRRCILQLVHILHSSVRFMKVRNSLSIVWDSVMDRGKYRKHW